MKIEKLRDCSRKVLAELAKKKGIAGYHDLSKDELVAALKKKLQVKAKPKSVKSAKVVKATPRKRVKAVVAAVQTLRRPQRSSSPPKRQIERSKYDVGVPTKDLSAKVPKDLPAGYGKDRIVVMVRDPYWLHAYWELTRQAVAAGRGRPGPGLARRQADPPPARRQQPRHHQHRRVDRPRHRNPRRLQQLVHRRRQPAALVPRRHRLPVAAAASSTSWPAPTSSARRAPASATSSTRTGPTSTPSKADRIYAMSGGFDPDRQQPRS